MYENESSCMKKREAFVLSPFIMDFLLERFRRLVSFLFGKEVFKTKICLTNVDVSSVEEVDRILETYQNPHQVVEFILEGKPTIQSIPIQLFFFSNLQRLILCGNQLQDIPWSVIYLRQLKELDVSFNALSILPRIVGHIPTLEVLSVRNNFITYLPTELLNLPKLKTFEAQDNPLVSPPPETVKQGLRSILDYLRKRKGRRNLFSDFTPWFSANDIPHTLEVPTLLELSIKCVLDCQIDFLGARDIPPRMKSNLEDIKKEELNSIFICKCDVCKKYFSNKFKFEIHDCGNKTVAGYFTASSIPSTV